MYKITYVYYTLKRDKDKVKIVDENTSDLVQSCLNKYTG